MPINRKALPEGLLREDYGIRIGQALTQSPAALASFLRSDIDGGVRERERVNLPSHRCWSVWWRWLLSQQCFRWIVLQSASISDAPQGRETENERRATERTDGEDLGTWS
ncbi:hypothetical protein DPX16_7414 [Anabarilius grahami]|uniref:Uncharacterized protein n=1 Tax=Anabarilius grahami TaxID=495550 RepID=A0A3N0Z3Z8_ANAGA|nr:hypothetical protein DPX16_7414 [Anabarilius grahami]